MLGPSGVLRSGQAEECRCRLEALQLPNHDMQDHADTITALCTAAHL